MAKQIAEMEIEKVTMELPDTKTIRLKWPDGYDVDFKTGQFITLYWPDTPTYKRAYSLSSCALDRGFFEVTIKREGKMGTRVVDWAKPGDKAIVGPPVGKSRELSRRTEFHAGRLHLRTPSGHPDSDQ